MVQRRETTTAGIETIGINLRRNALTSGQKWALARLLPVTLRSRAYDSLHPLHRFDAMLDQRPGRGINFRTIVGGSIEAKDRDRGGKARWRRGGGGRRDSIERIARYQGACYRVYGPADPFVHNKSIIAR